MRCIAVIAVAVVKITVVVIGFVITVAIAITAIFAVRVLIRNKVDLAMSQDVFDWRNRRFEKQAARLQQSQVVLSSATLS